MLLIVSQQIAAIAWHALLLLLLIATTASSDVFNTDSLGNHAAKYDNATFDIYANIADNATAAAAAATAISSDIKLRRGKRYLDFTRGTRISWRTNIKNNIVEANTLWAYAVGFRVNFPFPDKKDRLRPFNKRDVVQTLEESLAVHGLDGRACVLKSFCSAMLDAETHLGGGMLYKMLKLLFSLDANDKRHFPYLQKEHCHQIMHAHCPLSFNNISPYTDDV